MSEIEEGIHNLHAQSKEGVGVAVNEEVAMDSVAKEIPPTFARVDKVDDASPAKEAGLLPGDELVEFGSINAKNFSAMRNLAEVTYSSKGTSLSLVVVRQGNRVKKLSLMPRSWAGKGLLGCNIVPIEDSPNR